MKKSTKIILAIIAVILIAMGIVWVISENEEIGGNITVEDVQTGEDEQPVEDKEAPDTDNELPIILDEDFDTEEDASQNSSSTENEVTDKTESDSKSKEEKKSSSSSSDDKKTDTKSEDKDNNGIELPAIPAWEQ